MGTAGGHDAPACNANSPFTRGTAVPLAQALEQVIADAQRVGDGGQRGVDGSDAGEEAGVHDVQVVEIVGLAVHVEDRSSGVGAETTGARLVSNAGDRN